MQSSFLRTIILLAVVVLAAFIWYSYRQPRFIAGEKAPDFQIIIADGSIAHLSDLHGHYTLLQFWGSWCGPCRAENPQLVGLYEKYHAKGFEIFSIGIEANPTSWSKAILNDGMQWKYQAMESQDFNGGVAQLYNIKSIPATFLINPEGVITGVNLSPESMDKQLTGLTGF